MSSESSRTVIVRANLVEQERTRLAWSVETLAHEAGLSMRTLTRIQQGHAIFQSSARRLAKALGVSAGLLCSPTSDTESFFELRVRTSGIVDSHVQLAQLMSITQELVVKLTAAGIVVHSQDSSVSMPGYRGGSKRVTVSVEGSTKPEAEIPFISACLMSVSGKHDASQAGRQWAVLVLRKARGRKLLKQFDNLSPDHTELALHPDESVEFGSGAVPSTILQNAMQRVTGSSVNGLQAVIAFLHKPFIAASVLRERSSK